MYKNKEKREYGEREREIGRSKNKENEIRKLEGENKMLLDWKKEIESMIIINIVQKLDIKEKLMRYEVREQNKIDVQMMNKKIEYGQMDDNNER